MDKLKRYEHFDTSIGEGLVCIEDDVEKLEAENERLRAELGLCEYEYESGEGNEAN